MGGDEFWRSLAFDYKMCFFVCFFLGELYCMKFVYIIYSMFNGDVGGN